MNSLFRKQQLNVWRMTRQPDGLGGTESTEKELILDTAANVQDAGRIVEGLDSGDAVVFIDDVTEIQVGDLAAITWDSGDTTDATVTKVRRLDSSLALSYD